MNFITLQRCPANPQIVKNCSPHFTHRANINKLPCAWENPNSLLSKFVHKHAWERFNKKEWLIILIPHTVTENTMIELSSNGFFKNQLARCFSFCLRCLFYARVVREGGCKRSHVICAFKLFAIFLLKYDWKPSLMTLIFRLYLLFEWLK